MNELENPAPRNDNDIQATAKTTNTPPLSNRFLVYTSLAIICILAIFRHIKRQRTHLYASPPKRRKMSSSPDINPSGEHSEKSFLPISVPQQHTPNHSMHATTPPASSTSISTTTATAPFPSACDILQPLSQLTPLPASGHVAAAVIRGRKLDWNFTTNLFPEPAQIQGPGQSRRDSSADPENPKPASPHPDETVSAFPTSSRPAIPVTVDSDSPSVAGIGQALVSGSATCSCHPHPFPSVVAHGSSQGDYFFPPETSVDVDHDHATGSVQKRNETVHFLQDSDTDGPRSWKRLIVEYN
ncbi:hypothetical protein PHISCL_04179 [Aspergillus sclerotialis]|uniref:Uncharacterized protein n=1 Tax=Aspergillus sclerotialis TaxID=2070753 RepID=A0A3A2ZK87_9EURO|nr:hypothetical protein PHISCL_04179 [Aspergillus sclerotialis]